MTQEHTTQKRIISADRVHTATGAADDGATAVLVDGELIAALGSAEALQAAHPDAKVENYPGATIVPGLIESHVHPAYTGFTNNWADCRAEYVHSIADIQDALRKMPVQEGKWIVGWGYDDTLLAENRHPTRDDLDAVSRDTPILIRHISGHFAVGNTAALTASGISEKNTTAKDFPRGDDGRLTGLAWENNAVHHLGEGMPAMTKQEIKDAIFAALTLARSRGITTVHDMGIGLFGGPEERVAYQELADEGKLPVRVRGFLRGDLAIEEIQKGANPFGTVNDFLRIIGGKLWSDGSIQGMSAALTVPYACDHDYRGELLQPAEELTDWAQTIAAGGGQVAIHANGDAAVQATVAALSASAKVPGQPHRIEHCQVTEHHDLQSIADAGLAVSFFINHVYYWGDRHRDRFLGDERAERIDPLEEADRLGILFGLHSDCPITPMAPLHSLGHAVYRRTSSGATLGDQQRITPERALASMTIDSAKIVGDADLLGSIEAGKQADLVVLGGSLEDAIAFDGADPLATMIAGSWG